MKPEHLHIIQHALGCDQYGRGTRYRNHFVTGPDSDDFAKLRELVVDGLMEDHGPQRMAGGDHCFTVTKAGERAMTENSPQPPRLTRGQQNYQAFLDADCGMTFIEFLKARKGLRV